MGPGMATWSTSKHSGTIPGELPSPHHLLRIANSSPCATADWNASTMSANQYSAADALGFMQRLLPKLDLLPYVQRYSWFSGDPTSTALWPSALIGAGGQLTTLGNWYAAYQPNNAIKQ